MRLIDAEPIEKYIEDGLNCKDPQKRFGHDAIEILTEVHYAPTIATPPNAPLTLNELREMDSPVWCFVPDCDWIADRGYWCLCQHGEIVAPSGTRFELDEIPDWIFYRRKPEEV